MTNLTIAIDDCNYGNGNNTRKWRNNDSVFFFFFTMLDLVKLFSFSGFLCTIFFLHDTQLQSFVVIHFIHSYAIFFARFIYICMHVLFALFAYFYKHISNQGNKF